MSGDTFAHNLSYLRTKYALSRRALASLIGISPHMLRNIETGIAYPAMDIKSFRRLCDIFQVNGDDLAKTDLSALKN
jgi:transcriptional regulator with XRE-family HTH domain